MPPRLNELHPSLVHFPIALLPVAIGADLLARVTGSRRLADTGRALMPIAAASAAISAAAGLVAAVEANAQGKAGDLLVTHRNLNLSLTAITGLMAAWRWREEEAGPGYLALGLAGLGALSYSAYLGGKMVYEHGVGVKPADGLQDGDSPAIAPGHFTEAAKRARTTSRRASRPSSRTSRPAGSCRRSGRTSRTPRGSRPPGGRWGARPAGRPAARRTARRTTRAPRRPPDGAGAPESIP
jgi:uncharacterized membrane protein